MKGIRDVNLRERIYNNCDGSVEVEALSIGPNIQNQNWLKKVLNILNNKKSEPRFSRNRFLNF